MNILRLNDINGVLDAGLNILHFQIGVIIPNNGFKRNRLPDQFENRLHRNARPGNTRFPKMNFGADLNSIHVTNIHHSRHKRQAATWLPLFGRAHHCVKTLLSLAHRQNGTNAKQSRLGTIPGAQMGRFFPKKLWSESRRRWHGQLACLDAV